MTQYQMSKSFQKGDVKMSYKKIKRKRFKKYFNVKDLDFNKEFEIILSPRGRGCQDAILSKRCNGLRKKKPL